MQAGDVLIRDPRCLHRGSPNRSETPRVVAVIGCQRTVNHDEQPIPREKWDAMSEEERKRLRHFKGLVDE